MKASATPFSTSSKNGSPWPSINLTQAPLSGRLREVCLFAATVFGDLRATSILMFVDEGGTATVVAFSHSSRHPKHWKDRIRRFRSPML